MAVLFFGMRMEITSIAYKRGPDMFSVVLKGNLQIPHVDCNTEYLKLIYDKLQCLGAFFSFSFF